MEHLVLDVHRLRVLRELSHRGTLAAVAEALGYSPSAISQQLSQLEREAGVALLERVGRRVQLTPAATRLVGQTDDVLAALERAQADLANVAGDGAGTLRLAMFQSASHALLPGALTRLEASAPNLTVTVDVLESEVALPALVNRELDLVVAEEYPGLPLRRDPGVDRRSLAHDPLLLAERPIDVAPRPIDATQRLERLAGAAWIMEPPGSNARRWAESMCRAAEFEPRVHFQSIDLGLHVALVESWRAVAFLPRLVAPSRGIELNSLPGAPYRSIFTAVRRGAEHHPHVRAAREALAQDNALWPAGPRGQPEKAR